MAFLVKCKIAVATEGKNGLQDVVSSVFGRAKTFTIIDVENGKVANIKVVENMASNYHHGAGPITVKMLIDEGVEVVLANNLGIGASELLKQHKITFKPTETKTKVKVALEAALEIVA
ncbi:MAG: dinitrogenase iron-molybdenum cofactor [Candidatus Bathyarchaeum sp.]|nr:MAG: dinitrogenase iron-molybdenum cofactor [Candidatus Bathyarchaeum sp.]